MLLWAATAAAAGGPPRLAEGTDVVKVTKHHVRLAVLAKSAGHVMISHRGVNAPARRGKVRCHGEFCGRVWFRWVPRTTTEWSGCYEWTSRARNGFGKDRLRSELCLAVAEAGRPA